MARRGALGGDTSVTGRMSSMVEMVTGSDGLPAAAQLLHDFNLEYDEPSPPA